MRWPSGFFAYLSEFGSSGSENGQLDQPTSIAIDPEGDIWVTDSGNNRIQKFSAEGEFLQAVGTAGSENGQLEEPCDIAIDPEGDIWVADAGNSRLQEFNEEGEFIQAIGDEETTPSPWVVDVSLSGDVWTVNPIEESIVVLDQEGELVRQFGSFGDDPGKFWNPSAIDIDAEGNLWVAESGNNRVQQFDESGEYLGQFGAEGSGRGQFSGPAGIAVDEGGRIWIADSGNGRVQRWGEEPLYPTCFDGLAMVDLEEPFTVEAGSLECKSPETFVYDIITPPKLGEISSFNPATGSLVYTPDSEFSGVDSFTFHAHNDYGAGGPATFFIGADAYPPDIGLSGPLLEAAGGPLGVASAGLEVTVDDGSGPFASGLDSVEIQVGGEQAEFESCPCVTPVTFEYKVGEWKTGPKDVKVIAIDNAGNEAARGMLVDVQTGPSIVLDGALYERRNDTIASKPHKLFISASQTNGSSEAPNPGVKKIEVKLTVCLLENLNLRNAQKEIAQ